VVVPGIIEPTMPELQIAMDLKLVLQILIMALDLPKINKFELINIDLCPINYL